MNDHSPYKPWVGIDLIVPEEKSVTDRPRVEYDEHQLRVSLDNKRLTSLLLAILERKEKVRKERYNEIVKLLEDLRYVGYRTVRATTCHLTAVIL